MKGTVGQASLATLGNGSINMDRPPHLLCRRELGLKGAGSPRTREPPNKGATAAGNAPRRLHHSEFRGLTEDLRHVSDLVTHNNHQTRCSSVGFVEIPDTWPGNARGNRCLQRTPSSAGLVEIQGTLPNSVSSNPAVILRLSIPDEGARTIREDPLVATQIGVPLPRGTRHLSTMERSLSTEEGRTQSIKHPASCLAKMN